MITLNDVLYFIKQVKQWIISMNKHLKERKYKNLLQLSCKPRKRSYKDAHVRTED